MTRPFRPCLDCGERCRGDRCWSCFQASKNPETEPPPAPCVDCGKTCRAKAGVCRECIDLGNSSAFALEGGRWLVAGGIKKWVPEGHGYEWLARRQAMDRKVRGLLEERYSDSVWWARPQGPTPACPAIAAERIAAMVADFDQSDNRQRPEGRVA